MDKKILFPKHLKVFFIGIGGVSMSGLAKLLIYNGNAVSGSDKQKSSATLELENLGAKIYYTHSASNLEDADLVVYSSAISVDNPELVFANKMGIPTLRRSKLLGEILGEFKRTVAISGCHGKTTSTAMLSEILIKAGQDPTVFLGGEYSSFGNFLLGGSDLAIAEACEYKKSFLDLAPKIAVVLNIDNDHLDSFDGMKDVVSSFKQFVGDRLAIVNADDKHVNEICNCTTVTFGIDSVATYYATDIKEGEKSVSFTACAYAKPYGRINLKVNGKHNVYNALSAFATADVLGVPFNLVKKGLEAFNGVKRRNEKLGELNGVECYADYAHHPSEIKATLNAFSGQNTDFITVFQPHTYSRTKILMDDFINAFNGRNNVIIYKSYPAREAFDKQGSAKALKDNLEKQVPICLYAHTLKELKGHISKLIGDKSKFKRIIFLGAGDIYQIAQKLVNEKQNVQKKFRKR